MREKKRGARERKNVEEENPLVGTEQMTKKVIFQFSRVKILKAECLQKNFQANKIVKKDKQQERGFQDVNCWWVGKGKYFFATSIMQSGGTMATYRKHARDENFQTYNILLRM